MNSHAGSTATALRLRLRSEVDQPAVHPLDPLEWFVGRLYRFRHGCWFRDRIEAAAHDQVALRVPGCWASALQRERLPAVTASHPRRHHRVAPAAAMGRSLQVTD